MLALCTGCGPLGYIKNVAKDASRAVAEAQAAGAAELAPYEYWSSVTYLEQAKTLAAYSEYERSFDYAGRAKQLADEAKRKAQRREVEQAAKRAGEVVPSEASGEETSEPAEETPGSEVTDDAEEDDRDPDASQESP